MSHRIYEYVCVHCKGLVEADEAAPHLAELHDVPEGFRGARDPENSSRCLGTGRPTVRHLISAEEFVAKAETTFATMPR